MTTQITIQELQPVTHKNIAVLTTDLLANFYQTEVKNIQQNYKRNEDKFIEGKHYFKVSGSELATLRPSLRGLQISSKTRSLILWTERGAARHAKMLDTDQAWEVFEKLEDSYFDNNKTQSNLFFPDYREDVRKKALSYADTCIEELIKNKLPFPRFPTIDNEIIDGVIATILSHSRFVLSFSNDMRMQMVQVPMNAEVIYEDNKEQLLKFISRRVPIEFIPDLITAGVQRLSNQLK